MDLCEKIQSQFKIPCSITPYNELQIVTDRVGIDVLKTEKFVISGIAGWFKINRRKIYFHIDKDFKERYRVTLVFLLSINLSLIHI
mgnify:CR=1 FL=1